MTPDTTQPPLSPSMPASGGDLEVALGEYWDAAYAEGAEGRSHDTADGRAMKALHAIYAAIKATLPPSPAAVGADPFADIRDRRMSELSDEQKDRAHEMWLRDQMQSFPRHYWERPDALFPSVMRVIDRLRGEAGQPIDMVLHCPACGMQHIDAPDWTNDDSNAEQGIDPARDREAQQSHDAPVPVLLREGGVAPGGYAEYSVQNVPLSASPLHEGHEDVRVVQAGDGRVAVLPRQQDGEPAAAVQGLPQGRDGFVEGGEPAEGSGRSAAAVEGVARETSFRADAGGVPGARDGVWGPVRDLPQAGAAEAEKGRAVTRPLSRAGRDPGRTMFALQHDARLRERRHDGAAQRDRVPGEAQLTAPIHRSHLCRKEDGGCGHIWRPADVPTNGVAAVKTKGSNDSPIAQREYGSTALGHDVVGAPVTDGDKRLMKLVTDALGTDHPAFRDLMEVILAARSGAARQ